MKGKETDHLFFFTTNQNIFHPLNVLNFAIKITAMVASNRRDLFLDFIELKHLQVIYKAKPSKSFSLFSFSNVRTFFFSLFYVIVY